MKRHSKTPGRTITRRRELAQEIRNELDTYKYLVRVGSEEQRDRVLTRIDARWREMLDKEGCEP